MQIAILYASTLVIFLLIDIIGISQIIRPVFERHVGDLLAEPFRLLPAAGFYAAYIGGVLYFVSVPALAEARPAKALIEGALIGLMCYGTYEFTNYATLRDWSLQQVVTDGLWGGFLTGFSAWAGVSVTRWLT
ncbi:DUF2177 family protein [Paracoccus seriniphilus]|uniref:Uncharacterized membrane protein n=1 Tax=Paracoccus seriniphilus TaxID=184748 RepID=A0A239PV97_9RHOB|nr:DUF2177 family protein [Paracoccus seriniphilus]WCR15461.1 DUF2177 family protein [Paracoccus seriniphilus]SNT73953.1 Uncharacterized membrane protein [Paracoccus seriniphilus]